MRNRYNIYRDLKLTSVNKPIDIEQITTPKTTLASECDKFLLYANAYRQLDNVNRSMVLEDYKLINRSNSAVFKQHINNIFKNLDIDIGKPYISTEDYRHYPPEAINRTLALEGFLGDIWKKIKEVFTSIMKKVAEFFKRWFTRAGRLKARLYSIRDTIKETDKALKKVTLDDAPSSLVKLYPTKNPISSTFVLQSLEGATDILAGLGTIKGIAEKVAVMHVISPEAVEKLKQLSAQVATLNNAKTDAKKNLDENKKEAGALSTIASDVTGGRFGDKKHKDLKTEKETLEKEHDSVDKERKSLQNEIESAIPDRASSIGSTSEANQAEIIDKWVKKLSEEIEKVAKSVKGKNLIKGYTLVIDTEKKDDEVQLFKLEEPKETNDKAEIVLGSKDVLAKLVASAIYILEQSETILKGVDKIIGGFNTSIDNVDKVMHSIEQMENKSPSLSNYKEFANKLVKPALVKYKEVFVGFNKVNTTMLDLIMDTCDGVTEYSLTSLKYYG